MTNGFENDHEGSTGRALYPSLSLVSHSCQVSMIMRVVWDVPSILPSPSYHTHARYL